MIKIMQYKALLLILLLIGCSARAGIDWNDKQVEWHDYNDGLKKMASEGKNALLIVYADWCGVCKRYSKMFQDPEIIAQSKNVVLIRINQDTSPYAKKFSLDGEYVPRTYMLDKHGNILESPFKNSKYAFYLPPDSNKYLSNLLNYLGKLNRT